MGMLALCQHWSVWIGSHKTSAWLYKTFIFWRAEETVTSLDFYKGRGGGGGRGWIRYLVSLNVYPIGWVVSFYLCFLSDEPSNEIFTLYVFFVQFLIVFFCSRQDLLNHPTTRSNWCSCPFELIMIQHCLKHETEMFWLHCLHTW